MSFDTGGGFGSANEKKSGSGTWNVVGNEQGEPVLRLSFYDGEIWEYVITENDGKTLLNGTRYFRTYGTSGQDDGPNCL